MRTDLTRFDFRALRFLKSEDVELMTAEEVGQFVLLMCHAWLGGKNASLPNNPVLLAKYARCERVSEVVMREWKEGLDGRLYNETLSEEWDAAIGRSAHGTRAAAARWNREESSVNPHRNAPAMPEHCPSNPLAVEGALANPNQPKPIQSKTSSSETGVSDGTCTKPLPRKPIPTPEGFAEFWQHYPRKVAKAAALKAWRKLNGVDLKTVLTALDAVKQTEDWQKENGQFIPHPATWLNGRRWEDEVVLPVRSNATSQPGSIPQRLLRPELDDAGRRLYERAGVIV